MASSQVEFTSSSPFGYVLKDRNRYRTRESNMFHKNFEHLVQTRLNSCISGHSRNFGSGSNAKLNHQMEYTDSWVHDPQSPTNDNNHHSQNSDDRRISDHSGSNENSSHRHIDYTDLWVHNSQGNSNENDTNNQALFPISGRNSNANNPKKSKAGEKWAKARDVVFLFERKIQDKVSSSGPVSTLAKGRSQDAASSMPVSASQRGGRSLDSPSSGHVLTSQGGSSHEEVSLRPVLFQREKNPEGMPSGHDSRSQRENSPVQSEISLEVQSLGGVSSLVQKWRDFESEARCFSATNSPVCSSRSNSGLHFADNSSFADAPLRGSDACEESLDIRPATPSKSEDMLLDWESDQTSTSRPPSQGRDSDATENERTRVADIIRKLTFNGDDHNDTVGHESLPRVRTSFDKSDQRIFSPVSSSPRIRGRQAFTDLLMQMERDRHRELEGLMDSKAVSKFSYRGRIQAMLRLRFLRRGSEGKGGRHLNSTSSESNRLTESAIKHIRERFKVGANHSGMELRIQQGEVIDKTMQGEKISIADQQREEIHQQELNEPTRPPKVAAEDQLLNHCESNTMVNQNGVQLERCETFHQEAISSSDVIEETNNQQLTQNINGLVHVNPKAQGDWEEEEDAHQLLLVSDSSQASEVSIPFSGYEELQNNYQQQLEINQDWISDISRPRSTWEDLRQERYQEMLDPFLENNDIRQLLNRRTVSNFLSSGMGEGIDRLMRSRIQHQQNPLENWTKEEDRGDQMEQVDEARKVEMNGVEEEHEEPDERGAKEEEEESRSHNNDYEEDEENEVQIGQEYTEFQDYVQPTTSCDQDQNHEVCDSYSEPAAFPSSQQFLASTSSSPEMQRSSSFTNHPSAEMEFIYELRGNMEQLHQEISEMRRSIKSCINMQMKLQESIMQDGTIASCHSGRKKRRDSLVGQKSSRGRCYICYEMQIDSLLYRCGHMCTCFNCAHDLQWGSGKCPICQAPIIDVVRAYSCS